MAMASLYDLSPLLMLLGLGVLMAAGPLLWVWRRNRHASPQRRQQALTLLTLFLTFDLVLFGAFTRLSDSGLGCPDWPGCYGQASPIGARAPIAAAQAAMPTGPVTHGKAWVEMIHRYLATSVGALILALTVMAWLAHWARPPSQSKEALSPWWPTFTLFWVCLQGAFGALTVTMKLFPAIVTLHLLGGVTLLVLLGGQAIRQTQVAQGLSPVAISTGLRRLLVLTTLLLVLQLALGGWVSTNYAVLACSEFPTCQGQWWPPMNFEQGFELWRGLGLRADGTPISFAALTAIHYAHRLMAVLVLVLLGLLAWRLKQFATLRRLAGGLGALAILQLLTGLSNVVLGWPLLAALLHTGGAAALALLLTWVLLATRGRLGGWSSPDPAAFGIRA